MEMKRKYEARITSNEPRMGAGSALILAVVLTSLLAIVGVMFVMVARVDEIATSAIAENRELSFAVETVVAKISQELVLDVPGMPKGLEYYDYAGEEDKWLASLEPYNDGGIYKWRQVSDVTGYINREWGRPGQERVAAEIVEDHKEIRLDDGDLEQQPADADGDGVADSKWIELDDITSGNGKPIYAAIRVVDNGGMLNVNTAYEFDSNEPNATAAEVDGSRLAQVHMLDFVKGISDDADDLHRFRCDGEKPELLKFNDECAIRIENPDRTDVKYLPYDVSDELELRNRFVLDAQYNTTRIEAALPNTLTSKATIFGNRFAPIDTSGDFDDWKDILNPFDPNDRYNFRHLLTTCSIDRIIEPGSNGNVYKMININEETNVGYLYNVLINSIAPGTDIEDDCRRRFAQLAVNIVDFVDGDVEVTTFEPNDTTYYGFDAQPFITEIAAKIDTYAGAGRDYYAVELYNPFDKTIDLNDFQLVLAYGNEPCDIYLTIEFEDGHKIDADDCFVIASNLSEFDIYNKPEDRKEVQRLAFFVGWEEIDKSKPVIDIRPEPDKSMPPVYIGWVNSYDLFLKRKVKGVNGVEKWIYVDKQVIDRNWAPAGSERYYGRDVRGWHIVYQTLERDTRRYGSLGIRNNIDPGKFGDRGHNFSFFLPNPLRPVEKFITVGDIPRVLAVGPGTEPDSTIGEQLQSTAEDREAEIRLDLQNPYHRNVFQYLTVFDPSRDFDSVGNPIDNDGDGQANEDDGSEWKIPGRININTAPWYVISQLPWMEPGIAQAIVAYRDKLETPVNYKDGRYAAIKDRIDSSFDPDDIREEAGFASIGELNFVIGGSDDDYRIDYYKLESGDLAGFPDLTGGDGAEDDFEERDIIFSRISNLVTVRSDVFTAYILVRIGADGPQKRVIAVLDRSNVYSGDGKVRVVALHYVPDPR